MSYGGYLINSKDFDCEETGDDQDGESMNIVWGSQPDTGTSNITSAHYEGEKPTREERCFLSINVSHFLRCEMQYRLTMPPILV